MKKSTYILIAVVIAGAVALFAFFAILGAMSKPVCKLDFSWKPGEKRVVRTLPAFQKLYIKCEEEDENSYYGNRYIGEVRCEINVKEGIKAPQLVMPTGYVPYLKYAKNADGELELWLDFSSIESDSRSGRIYVEHASPFAINVPEGMLTAVRADYNSYAGIEAVSINGLTASKFNYEGDVSLELDKCFIDTLAAKSLRDNRYSGYYYELTGSRVVNMEFDPLKNDISLRTDSLSEIGALHCNVYMNSSVTVNLNSVNLGEFSWTPGDAFSRLAVSADKAFAADFK